MTTRRPRHPRTTKLLWAGLLAAWLLCGAILPGGRGAAAADPPAAPDSGTAWTQVLLKTSLGDIIIALEEEQAPVSTANFLAYVKAGFYDGTIFHRVIPDFMIQGGGMTADLVPKRNRPPIKNEAANGLKNRRGTVAMARTQAVDSATSQFFINLKDNDFLNHTGKNPRGYGYAVFGKVVEGMDVVDRIGSSPTRNRGGAFQNLPTETISIKSARKVER
jgi:cyclophilin family peptidyl-prolyl cis-trans isomerase